MYARINNYKGKLKIKGYIKDIPPGIFIPPGDMIVVVNNKKSLEDSIKKNNEVVNIPDYKKPVIEEAKIDEWEPMPWDSSKITKKIKKEIFALHDQKKYTLIYKLINPLGLTDDYYCCGRHKALVDYNVKILKDG